MDSSVAHATELPADIQAFVGRLTAVEDRGDLARLRRAAGRPLSQAGQALGLFYRLVPSGVSRDEEIYFLVATLYPLNPPTRGHETKGDFGTTMAALRKKVDLGALDRRMAILLDSDFDRIDGKPGGGSLSYRLRHLIKYAEAQAVGVDWGRLLADLVRWTDPERRVQKRWARSYYQGTRSNGRGGDSNVG